VANLLARRLEKEIIQGKVSVTLVGEGPDHYFQPANLEIAFKGVSPHKFSRPEAHLLDSKVNFVPERASKVDLRDRSVTLGEGKRISYSYMVLATGAIAKPEKMPGLMEGSFNFHTGPNDARRVWEALQNFEGGTVVVAIAGIPHKCPPSPNEAIFMLDGYFRKRGIRDKVKIKFLTPYPRAYPSEEISKVVTPLFERAEIEVHTFFNMESVDPSKRKVYSMEGEEHDYDLLIAVPPHQGADVILNSGIGDAEGWIPADRNTMNVQGYDDVYAIGDATAIPISKSGVVAHLQSRVVAHNLLSDLEGTGRRLGYNGRINCPMEVGNNRAIFVSATYSSPPVNQTPSLIKYIMKRSFGKMYWKALGGGLEWLFDLYFGSTSYPMEVTPEITKPTRGVTAKAGEAISG